MCVQDLSLFGSLSLVPRMRIFDFYNVSIINQCMLLNSAPDSESCSDQVVILVPEVVEILDHTRSSARLSFQVV